jgi:hypothetical protein
LVVELWTRVRVHGKLCVVPPKHHTWRVDGGDFANSEEFLGNRLEKFPEEISQFPQPRLRRPKISQENI